ncbi:MAG: hypothetical protein IMY88_05630 [Chloroflexi bacterium]|nr:hypothetical protein [Chloroflexota bacterium]
MENPKTIQVDNKLINIIKSAIDVALEYEAATNGKRKLGITGEVGEVLVCHQLGLRLVLDSRSEGFDAMDKDGLRVQIKTRRSETEGLPRDAGRTGIFSKHEFDYALLVLLDHEYELREIWQVDYNKLKPIIEKQKRRQPNLSSFKGVGEKIFDNNP